MDNIFFILSKVIWFLIEPENLIIIALGFIFILFILNKDAIAKKLFYFLFCLILMIATLPIGSWLIYPLETRFSSQPTLPEKVEGIILLGGSFDPDSSQAWKQVQTNMFADRIHSFLALLQRYPNAKAIFTGGNASLIERQATEAFYAKQLFDKTAYNPERIIYDDKARNTYENVVYSKQMLQPHNSEHWIVVSSAFHLPRTVGIFCQQNWRIIPYPAGYQSNPNRLFTPSLDFGGNLHTLNYAIREWIGLIAYYLTGKTHTILSSGC